MKNMTIIIFFLLFIEINLKNNYISIKFEMIDDCIRRIYISGQTIYSFDYTDIAECDFAHQDIYPAYFTKNYRYDYDIEIKFEFQDSVHFDGFMNITMHFNEYIIKTTDKTFWKCTNCGNFGNGGGNGDYEYYKDRINFYCGNNNQNENCKGNGATGSIWYTFIFKISSLNDVRKGGANGQFEVNNNYYALNPQKIYYRQIYYLDDELELINFNTTENFFIEENVTLPIEFTDYYFKMKYMDNNFNGILKALDTNDNQADLNDGSSFKVSDSMGLRYQLTEQEKNNRAVNVSLKITAYNCPNCDSSKSSPVCPETEFIFIITVYGYPPTTIPTTIPTTLPNVPTTLPNIPKTLPNIPITLPNLSTTLPYISPDTQQIIPNTEYIAPDTIISHCLDNYIDYDSLKEISIHYCPDYILAEVNENALDMIFRIDINQTYKIFAQDYVALITPIDYSDPDTNTNTEVFSPSSYANFSECEKLLRNYYKIYTPRKITFIQIELNNTYDNVLVNQVEYMVFDDNHTILNLSLCQKANIQMYYAIKPEKEEEIDLVAEFRDKGIDILDINDVFFNDICIPYSDSKKDLTLKNRIEEFYKNYTLCEKNCQYDEILFSEMMVICNCTIKYDVDVENINFDIENYEINIKNQNFKIIKCYKAFTDIKDNLKNIGFWIFLLLLIINIALLIWLCLSFKPIQEQISKEMAKKGYIRPNDEGHAFCHNYVKKLDKLIIRLNQMKSDFIDKKQEKKEAPPKKKTYVITDMDQSSRKNNLFKKKQKPKKNIDLAKNIESLKSRMDKTKRPNKKTKNINTYKLKTSNNALLENTTKSKNKLLSTEANNIKLKNKFNNIQTSNINNNNNKNDSDTINLINLNIKELKNKTIIPEETKHILNIYNFEEAVKYDKRSLGGIYYIFLISKQAIMHTIFYRSPIEPLPLRLMILKFIFACELALNVIFYTDDKITDYYNTDKNLVVIAFTNNIIIIFLSLILSYVILTFFIHMINSTNDIMDIFRLEEDKIKKDRKYTITLVRLKEIITEIKSIIRKFKIKVIIFFIIEFLITLFFWYYVTVFCNIYNKTQISWLFDCFITIVIKIIFELIINIIFSILYTTSIKSNCKCLYSGIIFIYNFG